VKDKLHVDNIRGSACTLNVTIGNFVRTW